MPNAGWITVDSVITDYIDESEQNYAAKYYRLYNIAIRGMDILGLDFFYSIKSVKLPVDGSRTVRMPSDALNYSKVGVFNGNGQVVPLAYNGNLSTYADLRSGRRAAVSAPGIDDYDFSCNVFSNYYDEGSGVVSNMYGIPSGAPFLGSFKVDTANNVIIFDLGFNYTHICLEYVAAPSQGGDVYIPIQFREALIAFIAWREIASLPPSRKGGLGDKRDRKSDFYNERKNAIARWKPLRLDQEYLWSLESTRMCVKA